MTCVESGFVNRPEQANPLLNASGVVCAIDIRRCVDTMNNWRLGLMGIVATQTIDRLETNSRLARIQKSGKRYQTFRSGQSRSIELEAIRQTLGSLKHKTP